MAAVVERSLGQRWLNMALLVTFAIAGGVLKNGLTLAAIGSALGLVIAVAITRAMQSLLYGVSSSDLVSYGVGTAAIIVVAFLASYLPARRAAAVEPVITLRAD